MDRGAWQIQSTGSQRVGLINFTFTFHFSLFSINDLFLMGRAMLSKSLIQFSVDGRGCVPSTLFDMMPNYRGGNEDNGDLLQKVPYRHCYIQCPKLCSRPPLTHASAGDSWTLIGKSGSASCVVTAPFSWVPVHRGSACAL